ncbi:MAG: hypothetical protein E7256_07995 [Lachnospiraceae bacterium]|nr:hypothetical protein [Lachnospiraceae bacterium]
MNRKQRASVVYQVLIGILAVMAVGIAIEDVVKGLDRAWSIVDTVILWIFVLDYVVRFILAGDRKRFLKENVLDLLAILPFNSMFRGLRIFKVRKLLRISKVTTTTARFARVCSYGFRWTRNVRAFLNTNGFKYMLVMTVVLTFAGGIGIHFAEDMSLEDGVWWAFVTVTTVGYGDISPHTLPGRVVAGILMLTGIGLIGSITSTLTSYFFSGRKERSYREELVEGMKNQLDHMDDMSEEDLRQFVELFTMLWNQSQSLAMEERTAYNYPARVHTGRGNRMNQVYQNILSRRSCRSFTTEAVKQEDLELILKAGVNAPSGMNRQSWRFTVIQDKEKMMELAKAVGTVLGRGENYDFYRPDVIVLVSNDRENSNGLADCACALQNMFLMANSLGIGSCWINQLKTICDDERIRPLLDSYGIPKEHIVWGIADLGYAKEEPKEKVKDEAVIHYVG